MTPTDERHHGVTCPKAVHKSEGYLHDADDDGPYDVEGMIYCGRCHYWLGVGDFTEPREARLVDFEPDRRRS